MGRLTKLCLVGLPALQEIPSELGMTTVRDWGTWRLTKLCLVGLPALQEIPVLAE